MTCLASHTHRLQWQPHQVLSSYLYAQSRQTYIVIYWHQRAIASALISSSNASYLRSTPRLDESGHSPSPPDHGRLQQEVVGDPGVIRPEA